MGIGYVLTGLGVTVGFHRLFTHRSFKTRSPVRALFAVLGSAAVEGPLIEWVATHRMHHRFIAIATVTHTALTSTETRAGAAPSQAWLTRIWAGFSARRTLPPRSAMPRTCSPTP